MSTNEIPVILKSWMPETDGFCSETEVFMAVYADSLCHRSLCPVISKTSRRKGLAAEQKADGANEIMPQERVAEKRGRRSFGRKEAKENGSVPEGERRKHGTE